MTFRSLSLPLKGWMTGFALITLLLLALMAWLLIDRIDAMDRSLQAAERESAREELAYAIETTLSRFRKAAREIAAWDEVRQQLLRSEYYAYWRTHRLHKQGTLPAEVIASELYDRNGKMLGDFSETPLPVRKPGEPSDRIRMDGEGRVVFEHFEPVTDRNGELLGWAGLHFDLIHALRQAVFSHLDPATLDVTDLPADGILPEQMISYLRYETRPNRLKKHMLNLLRQTGAQIGLIAILIVLAISMLIHFLVSRPLGKIAALVQDMNVGTPSLLESLRFPVLELEKVRESLHDYHNRLNETRRVLDHRNRELWRLAHLDPLTGVLNRRAFDEDWSRMVAGMGDTGVVTFLLLDCDHFKAINDTYGHMAGDEVLRRIAKHFQQSLRASDHLYRLGGDEFAALLPNCDRRCAREVAERCLHALDQEDFSDLGIHEPVRVSIGVAVAEGSELPPIDELKRMADMAMYHAKRPNQPRIQFYAEHMDREGGMLYSSRILHTVQRALGSGEGIEMHYQPVVDLDTGRTLYREALVRIRTGDELLLPGRFLPIIEAHRQEVELDLAVIDAIRRDAEQGRLPMQEGISVNISGVGITRKDVMEALGTLAGTVVGRPLILEITETAYISQIEMANRQIRMAHGLGYRIALDDFGSGYSSLRYLATMPFDIIKFDISMIRQLSARAPQRMITERMVKMLNEAGYRTVAEGIEDEVALGRVRDAGFGLAQGFHLGRPAPPSRSRPETGRPARMNT